MIRLLWRLILLVLAGFALIWLADRPGTITVNWQGQELEISVLVGVIGFVLAVAAMMFLLWLLRRIWRAPGDLRSGYRVRKEKKAYQALSRGIVAAGAGDAAAAARHAALAGDVLTDEPLVHLLGAQAAQLRGDKAEVGRVFEKLSKSEDTALLGLRGLHAQARERGDVEAAKRHAEAAHSRNENLAWAQAGLLHSFLQQQDWQGAAKLVAHMGKRGVYTKAETAQKQAALLCAAGQKCEHQDKATALKFASDAHSLDAALVPAALLMARIYLAQEQPKRALKVLRETWAKTPHRSLAALAADAYADSAEDRFERVRDLVGKEPAESEGRIALAQAAVGAQRFDVAREALAQERADPSASVCALMAEIEEHLADHGKARNWLAQGVSATEPCWMADGMALAQWTPVSPTTGEVVACVWTKPTKGAVSQIAFKPGPEASPPTVQETAVGKSHLPPPPDDPGVE